VATLAALVLGGCGESEAPAPDGDAERQAMVQILRAVEDAGHVPLGETAWYTADNLFEYIDGMAPYFTDSGFERLAHSEWHAAETEGDAYVELDLYDMGSAEGALDILCDSRYGDTAYLDLGDEAHDTGTGIEMRAGRYYVKIVPRRDMEGQKAFVRSLAETVARTVPARRDSDAELAAPLPSEGILPHTVAYTTKGFLGKAFLNGVREATYETGGKRVRLFVMDAGGTEQAGSVFTKWKASVEAQPMGGDELPNVFACEQDYVGHIFVAHEGRYLAGAIGDAAAARPLLLRLLPRLSEVNYSLPCCW